MARKRLGATIKKAETNAWEEELINEFDYNPWSKAYQIVTKKFGRQLPNLSRGQTLRAVLSLSSVEETERTEIPCTHGQRVTIDDLNSAAARINKRAQDLMVFLVR